MAPTPEQDRLRQLDEKLAAARARRAPPPKREEHYSQASQGWRMVIELVAGLGVGVAIGLGVDAVFGIRPFGLIVFTLLGFAAGVNVMMRTAREFGSDGGAHGGDLKERDADGDRDR